MTNTHFNGSAFGLSFKSCIDCKEFNPISNGSAKIDIEIGYGNVSNNLENAVEKGILFQAAPLSYHFKYGIHGRIGKFLVTNGNRITIHRGKKATENAIKIQLLGPVLAAVLLQRGLFPFHASAIEKNGAAYIFIGNSTCGKSTLAAAFGLRGFRLLADDLTLVTQNNNGEPIVWPGLRRLKLWEYAIQKLGVTATEENRISPNIEKFSIPLNDSFHNKPVPLKRIYFLPLREATEISISRMAGRESADILLTNTFGIRYVKAFGEASRHLFHCLSVANAVSVHKIEKAKRFDLLDSLLNRIEEDMSR